MYILNINYSFENHKAESTEKIVTLNNLSQHLNKIYKNTVCI